MIVAANLMLVVLTTKVRGKVLVSLQDHKSHLQRFYIFKLPKLNWLTFTDLKVHLSINI